MYSWGALGTILLVLASPAFFLWGLWRLVSTGRVGKAVACTSAVIAFPIMLFLVSRIADEHVRFWVGMPVALMFPVWLLSGFLVSDMAGKTREQKPEAPLGRANPSPRRRLFGALALCVGLLSWLYGLTHPSMAKTTEMVLLGLFLYGTLLGSVWTVTGKGMQEL